MIFRELDTLTPEQEENLRTAIIANDPAGFAEGLFSVPISLRADVRLPRMSKAEARAVGASFLLGRELGIDLAKKDYSVKTKGGAA